MASSYREDYGKNKRDFIDLIITKIVILDSIKPNFAKKLDSNCGKLILDENYYVNEYINSQLRDYQRDGIRFLFKNYISNNGCILADDMGLGI